jgi:aminoglycoside phosphotransferase (APT) family kinase protein
VTGPDDDSADDFEGGWDNQVRLVDGRWVHRTPRYADREPQLRREAELLPWLAPQLPVPVPAVEVVSDDPFTVRHPYLPGTRCPGTSAAHGPAVGAFLRALHDVDAEEAVRHGARDADASYAELRETFDRMERDVLPLLPAHVAHLGGALLERLRTRPSLATVVHGDLGPEHIRVVGDEVTGVIDWGDSGVFDPALDLAWTTQGAAPAFADAVVAAYAPEQDLLFRARDWHLLGPWHEVLYGLGSGGPEFVDSGLAGTVDRLERLGTDQPSLRRAPGARGG